MLLSPTYETRWSPAFKIQKMQLLTIAAMHNFHDADFHPGCRKTNELASTALSEWTRFGGAPESASLQHTNLRSLPPKTLQWDSNKSSL
ncbi:hypothetical protein Y032_0523g2911 [Ancylostoma ceylanicum]|uniref:Uncharacterized protein n=1 Tax=Ancylostoma ceylanicum TaxID=53326 RepID=A0A016WUD7_9BILA|nr:hypothetical protein Y032_0523g2911 [Ancylostoma ceylanicum]